MEELQLESQNKEEKKNDHRYLGRNLALFSQNKMSPGSAFWAPKGTVLYRRLVEFMRTQCIARDYEEVQTPNIFLQDLWEKSGHAANYGENMFHFATKEQQSFSLKPMNCPGHCLLFESSARSYHELPLAFFEFGVLHRNELSGTLTGLTRVRKFVQDDAHIFCAKEDAKDVVLAFLDLVDFVYRTFGFAFRMELSTRPETRSLGGSEEWQFAETVLRECLETRFPGRWSVNKGDGAFYAPKIDFKLFDRSGKEHQCATVQLDLQTPRNFGLTYIDKDTKLKTPVIVHRAVLGSIERFVAILTEHFEGKFPFWIAPYQFVLVPVAGKTETNESDVLEYAKQIRKALRSKGVECDLDNRNETLAKKIVAARALHVCYLAIVGQRELKENTITVRKGNTSKTFSYSDFFNKVQEAIKTYRTNAFSDEF